MEGDSTFLEGGNMNPPELKDNRIYKIAHGSSRQIHRLLCHVRKKGIDFVPESCGFDQEGRHVFSYLPGEVCHDTPDWLWSIDILRQAARILRRWHDATMDFKYPQETEWMLDSGISSQLQTSETVICHGDFAPYNCLFTNKQLSGLIDFDTCCPGSRLWDIGYALYRFIPLMPIKSDRENQKLNDNVKTKSTTQDKLECQEFSPFTLLEMSERVKLFLHFYSEPNQKSDSIHISGSSPVTKPDTKSLLNSNIQFSIDAAVVMAASRVSALATWTRNYSCQTKNNELMSHAKMYDYHNQWILNNKSRLTT